MIADGIVDGAVTGGGGGRATAEEPVIVLCIDRPAELRRFKSLKLAGELLMLRDSSGSLWFLCLYTQNIIGAVIRFCSLRPRAV